LPFNPSDIIQRFQILLNNRWENISDVDYANNTVMLENGEVAEMSKNNLTIRRKIA